MNVLMVGAGSAGSFQMRGLQLGIAMGARVTTEPTAADWAWADRIVLIKRAAFRWAEEAQRRGCPVVWDALDFWAQPAENGLTESAARLRLSQAIALIRPTLTIGATQAMADAADGMYLPHHGHLSLVPRPERAMVRLVAYNGNPAYLGAWAAVVDAACAARGWTFVINPPDLAAADLIIALRGGPWDGWICRAWKSGVKLVNAMLAGRPVITQPSAAARELGPAGSVIETPAELSAAFDLWRDPVRRASVAQSAATHAKSLSVSALATRYTALLADL